MSDVVYRLAWLIALRAPALRNQALVTGMAQVELIAAGKRSWAETLEHHRKLERVAPAADFVGRPDPKRLDSSLERAMGLLARQSELTATPAPPHEVVEARTRLVFLPIVREPAFAWVADQLGWSPLDEPKQYASSLERVWLPKDSSSKVTYIDDKIIDRQYLIVEGRPDAAARVREAVAVHVPLATRDTVRAMLDAADSTYDPVSALYIAALIAPSQPDQEILSWFADAMAHSHPDVRRAAYFSTTYPGWREFERYLIQAGDHDVDSESREVAKRALAALRRNTWREA